ncbi:MAG: DNA mismatch repair protein MutT [Bacteroidales bacterium]|nr:DNA mismatch repair protein MutT [Candidatus Liminaster caballi]
MKQNTIDHTFDPHVSIDCVILGFDGESLQVLLTRHADENPDARYSRAKLPGRLLYTMENPDDAANDIINQLTGTRNHYVKQFRAFGSPTRTNDPKDVLWLENAINQKIGRIVTIAYLSVVKINNRTHRKFAGYEAAWYKVNEMPDLAFDHGDIIREVLKELEQLSSLQPQVIFEMLPAKFTALQMRHLYEQICGHEIDVRNFSKLVLSKPYIVPLDEWEQNVSHRAARYYKFQASKMKK